MSFSKATNYGFLGLLATFGPVALVPQFLKGINIINFIRKQLPPLHWFEKGKLTPAQKKPVFQKSVAIH